MSAAQLALRARVPKLNRSEVDEALWRDRSLVKTYAMRGTLHLLASDDFPVYISALQRSRMRQSIAIMARYGVSEAEVFAVRDAVLEILGSTPMPRRELSQRVFQRVKVSKKAKFFFDHAYWGVFRQTIIEGLVCYGPSQGPEMTLVRIDQWLPKRRKLEEVEAQAILLRRYLGAYGPAGIQDFAKWAGFLTPEAKAIGDRLRPELAEVEAEARAVLILRDDYDELAESDLAVANVRLLPNFDPYMLAHLEKDHLIDPAWYKRVYRSQWWISPVVLLNGRAVGTWATRAGKRCELLIKPFEKLPKKVISKIKAEAASLANFLETPLEVRLGS